MPCLIDMKSPSSIDAGNCMYSLCSRKSSGSLFVKERSGIDNDSPGDAAAHLRGVCLLVLHAEGVAQNLKDLKH